MENTACRKEETDFNAREYFLFIDCIEKLFLIFLTGLSVKAVATQQGELPPESISNVS